MPWRGFSHAAADALEAASQSGVDIRSRAFLAWGSGDALAPPVPSDQARLPAGAAAGRGRV